MNKLTVGLIGFACGVVLGAFTPRFLQPGQQLDMEPTDTDSEAPEVQTKLLEVHQPSAIDPRVRQRGDTRKGVFVTEEELAELLSGLGPGWISPIPENAEAHGPKVGGLPHGDWTLFYEHKGVTDSGSFVFGSRFGEWVVHDKQGNILRTRTYVNGKIEGVLRERDSVDEPWFEFDYVNGELVSDRYLAPTQE